MPPDLRRSRSALLAFLLLLALTAAPDLAQAQDRSRFLHWAVGDAVSLAQQTSTNTALYALGGAVLLAPASLLDVPLSHEVKARSHGLFAAYLDVTNELGSPHMTKVAAGLFGLSLITDDTRFQDAAFTSLESLVYAGLLSYGVKYTVGRFRPEDSSTDPHRFAPFSGSTSFPSGHTNAAFAVLTPWALYYPHPVTYSLLVAGAGGTAVARISRDRHWTTDVLAGGALGFLTAYFLTRQHQGTDLKGLDARLAVTPAMGPEAFTVVLQVDF